MVDKKWEIKCLGKGDVLYCDIIHDGKNIGYISAMAGDVIAIEIESKIHEEVGEKIEMWDVPTVNTHIFYLKPTEEQIEMLKKKGLPWYGVKPTDISDTTGSSVADYSYQELAELCRKHNIPVSSKSEMIKRLREKGVI